MGRKRQFIEMDFHSAIEQAEELEKIANNLLDLAEEDLENAGDYIAFVLLNPIAAADTVEGIRAQIRELQFFPERHELDEDSVLAELGVRRIYFKEYKIFYKIEEDTHTVFIIRIIHMRMNSRAWLYRTLGISE